MTDAERKLLVCCADAIKELLWHVTKLREGSIALPEKNDALAAGLAALDREQQAPDAAQRCSLCQQPLKETAVCSRHLWAECEARNDARNAARELLALLQSSTVAPECLFARWPWLIEKEEAPENAYPDQEEEEEDA